MRCTSNGYFELTQCFDSYCVCVDPKTGLEAGSTRTQTNKIAPKCGTCHLKQSNQVARDLDSNLPQCDSITGDYQAKQCTNDNTCWCVDTKTGVRTRDPIKKNSELNCGNNPDLSFSIDSPSTKEFGSVTGDFEREDYPVGDPVCKLPKAKGTRCSGNSSKVQWYFDTEVFDCLAFRHEGCGGNGNRFDSISNCWSKCKLADMGGCAGSRKAARNSKGETIICSQPGGMKQESCPTGYKCQNQAFFGICCHTETEDLYLKNYRPTCSNNRHTSQITSGGITMNILGKSCDDNFCPTGTTCHKLEVLAHCCSA
uniref:BPTI/Kunitz inhibitor domain-containing protein n=1 Tax=Acrobeloides nanus TaxID=290746 RepID=A0A914EPB7_9BILA